MLTPDLYAQFDWVAAKTMKLFISLIFLLLSFVIARKSYRLGLDAFQFCNDTDLPFADPLPFEFHVKLYNGTKGYTLMGGNVTIEKDIMARDYRGTFSAGIRVGSGINWILKINDFNCNSFVIKALLGGCGVPIKGCVVKKGIYQLKDIDVDTIENAFFATGAPSRVYGNYVVKIVLYSKTRTIACWRLIMNVSPIQKQRGLSKGMLRV